MTESGTQSGTRSRTSKVAALTEPGGRAAEAYRTIRTGLLYGSPGTERRVVCVSSAGSREGKTTTCANLAAVMAQAGKRVLVVDCDLRHPSMNGIFEVSSGSGVADILSAGARPEEIWHEPAPNLALITAGSGSYSPPDLLGSERFSSFIEDIAGEFDHIFIDTPPIQLFSDALIVATKTDGVLLVINAQKTRKSHVRRTVQAVESVGSTVIGTVLNNMAEPDLEAGAYTYSYGHTERG